MRSRFYSYLIASLFLLLALGVFLIPVVEGQVLKARQAAAIAQVSQEGHHALNAEQAVLGTPTAVLTIPKITLRIPVYQGTSESVLENGVGILEGTGDLSGGIGKNPVLASHSGLAKSNLFTDLDQVKEKDVFFLKLGQHQHEYQVFRRKIVPITQLQKNPERYLAPDAQQEEVTLLTCISQKGSTNTNAYRLLVTGRRVPFQLTQLTTPHRATILSLPLVVASGLLIVTVLFILFLIKRRKGGFLS